MNTAFMILHYFFLLIPSLLFVPCFSLIVRTGSTDFVKSLSYKESNELIESTNNDVLTAENFKPELYNDSENHYPSYYTLDPTLDLLVDWTLDFVDAIDLAGGMTRISVSVESMLAEDFVFASPNVGPVCKHDFITLMNYYQRNGLDLGTAVPDLTVSYEGWHQDPHNPWRIWTVARYSGTHTGIAKLPGSGLTLSPKNPNEQERFTTGPELQSFLWSPNKMLMFQTVGYVGDEHTGSGKGHGSLDGLLVSMGLPPLYLESTESIRNLSNWFSQFRNSDEAPRLQSPYSYLPQWWHERKTNGQNFHR